MRGTWAGVCSDRVVAHTSHSHTHTHTHSQGCLFKSGALAWIVRMDDALSFAGQYVRCLFTASNMAHTQTTFSSDARCRQYSIVTLYAGSRCYEGFCFRMLSFLVHSACLLVQNLGETHTAPRVLVQLSFPDPFDFKFQMASGRTFQSDALLPVGPVSWSLVLFQIAAGTHAFQLLANR